MADSIDYFYRGHWLTSLQERVSLRARLKMFNRWLSFSRNSQPVRVLDVGSTPDLERSDSNCMLKWCLEQGMDVTAVSLENLEPLKTHYTSLKLEDPLPPFPIKWKLTERSYDWCVTSAVIEHVGSLEQQIHFLSECARICNGIFLTTPYRFHWLEFHTKLPLLHWLPKKFHRRILKLLGLQFWSSEQNLNLLSKKELESMARQTLGEDFDYSINWIWTLGMPSNLILLARRKN